jgi:hypothetical protein
LARFRAGLSSSTPAQNPSAGPKQILIVDAESQNRLARYNTREARRQNAARIRKQ